MVVLIALSVLTLHCSPALILLTYDTLIPKPLLLDILYPFYVYHAILLLEVAFRNPNSTHIVYPYIVAHWYLSRIGGLHEIVIVAFFFLLSSLTHHLDYILVVKIIVFIVLVSLFGYVFFLLFVVGAFLGVFVVLRVRFFENVGIYMDWSPFHSTSFDIT